jgi:hypothetical protein
MAVHTLKFPWHVLYITECTLKTVLYVTMHCITLQPLVLHSPVEIFITKLMPISMCQNSGDCNCQ